ncbi:SoxR reducing system RseC family protein [Simiduia agarivorans]|uniref:Sigma E positive regulator RseC/MucC n=1 Tax=Simiduia agarivorans (strain DSM 21679 / JCM 13881 / BCRC 17597 / SA1) TaxID=1117647 RepID=K4KI51_SIMAS|nr:SoxR reducing system RseC family protein [Simiduia agarivorans]AFU97880.1 sigma E positive regulator RseC/MucC [Simiduia agarivorans SA1 = DSM 21679]
MERIAESGVVVRCDQSTAWVKTIQRSSCASCQARHGCGQSSLQSWFETSDVIPVSVHGEPPEVGQTVSLSVPADALAKAALLVYLVPLSGLLAGLFVAETLFGQDVFAAIGAGIGLIAGCVAVRCLTARLKDNADYAPALESGFADHSNHLSR